jgi:hypothetical protein
LITSSLAFLLQHSTLTWARFFFTRYTDDSRNYRKNSPTVQKCSTMVRKSLGFSRRSIISMFTINKNLAVKNNLNSPLYHVSALGQSLWDCEADFGSVPLLLLSLLMELPMTLLSQEHLLPHEWLVTQ